MLLSHNISVYNQLEQTLSEHKKAIVVMGTGVGKTYVTKEYLDNHKLFALVVTPRLSINESWHKVCGNNIDTITYSKFKNIYKNIDYTQYDVVVCDEVTHIGAPQWGKGVKWLIDNKIIPVIGLTENSIRYTDGARDVGEEFFDNKFCFGESVATAIEKKVLNPITYVGALYNTDGLRNEIRGRIVDKLYAQLDLAINNTPTVEEIIKKNMPKGKRKGIIFAPTISEIKSCVQFLNKIYPTMKIYPVHSKQSPELNQKYLRWFDKTDEGFLCSVDMLSEGVHLKGVNTLFMLRRTESPNVFSQQLGRCLSANNLEGSVLFDLVNNKTNIKISAKSIKVKIPSVFPSLFSGERKSSQIIIKDYTKDIVKVLKEIQEALSLKPWTEEENNLIRYYSEHKAEIKMSAKKFFAINIPNHPYSSTITQAWRLGIKLGNVYEWGEKELKVLKEYYHLGVDAVYSRIDNPPNRHQIMDKARTLGLSVDGLFSKEEDELIKKYYPTMGYNMSYMIPNKTKRQIASHARDALGLRSKQLISKYWTEEEDQILRDNYSKGYKAVLELLPKRSKDSIMCRAKVLKLPNNVYRKVRCVETGQIFNSITEAGKAMNIDRLYINECLSGKKKSTGGYHWEYYK